MAAKLIKNLIQRLSQKLSDPHLANIQKVAESEVKTFFGVDDISASHMASSPPTPMEGMPRAGKAWFLHFPYLNEKKIPVKNILVVEVDDATETVTRLWSPQWPKALDKTPNS